MNKTTFSLSVFGERAAFLADSRGGSNGQYIAHLKRQLARAINETLTERQRQTVMLYYYENKNTVEIAAQLGLNRSTVSRHLRRAVEKLSLALRFCEPYSSDD